MKHSKKYLALLLAVLFTMSIIAGCTTTGTTTTAAKTTAGGTTTKAEVKPVEPTKLTMFFGNAGIAFPDDIDPDDNPFFDIFEKAANVQVEMIMPSYTEFQTRFNLALSTGDIPDLVHSWYKADVDRYGMEGAFLDWYDLLPKSTTLKTYYSADALKLQETTDGGIYGLNVLANGNVHGPGIRVDLVNEVNGGKMPNTPDELYDFFKNIKAKYPDAVPVSPNSGASFYRANGLFYFFGVQPWGLQTLTNSDYDYFWFFEHKNMKDALSYVKKLYDEDLLYKEFATVTADIHGKFVKMNKLAYYDADEGNLTAIQQGMSQHAADGTPPDGDAIWVFAPPITAPGVNSREAYQSGFYPIGWHCVSVNSKTNAEQQAAIMRLLEALADKELLDYCVWGREGIEYTVASDGRRIIDTEAHMKSTWRLAYQFYRTYYYSESMEYRIAASLEPMTPEQRTIYNTEYAKGLKKMQDAYNLNPPVTAKNFIKLPDLAPKVNEAALKAREITYRYIMGEITMEQFDKDVADFMKTYAEIKDAYNADVKKYIN